MTDKFKIGLSNFRSVRQAEVELAPLTVLYGTNGAGKSSLLYGLLTLRNFITNPQQDLSGLFSYPPSISLGGFQEVVYDHNTDLEMGVSLEVASPDGFTAKFQLVLKDKGGRSSLSFSPTKESEVIGGLPTSLQLDIDLPHFVDQLALNEHPVTLLSSPLGKSGDVDVFGQQTEGAIIWDGLHLDLVAHDYEAYDWPHVRQSIDRANLPIDIIKNVGVVPLRRGFVSPQYQHESARLSETFEGESTVANSMANAEQRFQGYKVSEYAAKVMDRRVQIQNEIGTDVFAIDSIPQNPGISVPVSVVNEGFGINQIVYMLAICLHPSFKMIAIEEPEIHLHPSMVRRLARVLAELSIKEDRRLVVTTHSENFVSALLTQVAKGEIRPEDLAFVFVDRKGGSTVFERNEVSENGQITGGLYSFMEGEAEDLAEFLGLNSTELEGYIENNS